AFVESRSKGPSASSPSRAAWPPVDKPSPAKRRRTSLAFKEASIEQKERPRRRQEQKEQERAGRVQREPGAGQRRLEEREQPRSRDRDAPGSVKGKGKAVVKGEPDLADAAAKDLLRPSRADRTRPKPSPSQPPPDPASRTAFSSPPRQTAASLSSNSHPSTSHSTSSTSQSRAPAATQLPQPRPAFRTAVSSPRRDRAPSPTPRTPPHPSTNSASSKPAFSSSSRRPPPAPTPPTLAAFLASLPLPSLERLTPHFASLGLSTPSDLLALAQPTESGRRVRRRVLERLNDGLVKAERNGGGSNINRHHHGEGRMTEWERIVLEEELEEGWRRWMGVRA
ncbi:hypothetical protein JCM1841_007018, partial [Sporobolomyces salmonicolor]